MEINDKKATIKVEWISGISRLEPNERNKCTDELAHFLEIS